MNFPIHLLNMPEYLYQPSAAARRLLHKDRPCQTKNITLRWGIPIEVDTRETIGRALSHHGLFEMAVVEAIFRLVDPTDLVLDIGANIGFMSAAAFSAGAQQIHAFEPHPKLFTRLSANANVWNHHAACPVISCHQIAVSSRNGIATLAIPEHCFDDNAGIASLEQTSSASAVSFQVTTITLDTFLAGIAGPADPIGLLKIDIEGHELSAFRGAECSLHRIRDIIFEDHAGLNSAVCCFLRSHGFTVFGLNKTPFGPILLRNRSTLLPLKLFSNDNINFVATRNVPRLQSRFSSLGYRCLARR